MWLSLLCREDRILYQDSWSSETQNNSVPSSSMLLEPLGVVIIVDASVGAEQSKASYFFTYDQFLLSEIDLVS